MPDQTKSVPARKKADSTICSDYSGSPALRKPSDQLAKSSDRK